MRIPIIFFAIVTTAIGADKPRVFITESSSLQVAGNASVGDVTGALSVTGGTSRENLEVIRSFSRRCPDVVVTSSREKADYVMRLDHAPLNPYTPIAHRTTVAVFNKDEDLIFTDRTRILSNSVKGVCKAILGDARH